MQGKKGKQVMDGELEDLIESQLTTEEVEEEGPIFHLQIFQWLETGISNFSPFTLIGKVIK